MANGFFLGGAAEGMETARRGALEELKHTDDVGLRTRGLDLQERQVRRAEQNDLITRADKQVADTMAIVAETIKQGLAVGRDPGQIRQVVAPLVQSAQAISQRIGGNPSALGAQVDAMLMGPTGTEAATAAGRAAGTKEAVTQTTAAGILQPGGADGGGGGFIIDPAKRGEAETKLRTEYLKQSDSFIQVRDAISRMRGIEDNPIGDLGLVYSYMKIQDPGGRVTEGEVATSQNAGGVSEQVRRIYNNLVAAKDGKPTDGPATLSENQRRWFREESERAYQRAAINHDKRTTQYATLSKNKGLNPNNVIVDLLPLESFKTMEAVQAAIKENRVKIGDKIIFNGQVVTVQP